ncbi:MAG: F0F1 ATP synthase subunit B [Clostridiales bacterium]|nr:F0F1 ATP synthase subunit B [Clostridiales bacterium]
MNSVFLSVGSFILTLDKNLLVDIGIQLINTCILCFVLSKLLYKPVLNFMKKRRERIASEISNADNKLKDADAALAEYNKKLAEIHAERAALLDEANKEANANKQAILEAAKQEAAEIKSRAMLQIEREQEKARDEIRLQIIQVSSLIAGKFVAESLTEAKQEQLVNDVIKDLGDVKWQS